MLNKILVVSPHPDDETLGCGASLVKWGAQGHVLYWLNLTGMKTEYGFSESAVCDRAAQIKRVGHEYGFKGTYDLGLRPAGLDRYPKSELTEKMHTVLSEVKPDRVIIPFKHDVHSDHVITAEIVSSCTKVFRAPYVKEVLMMEICSETDFVTGSDSFYPNYFVDVSEQLLRKIDILKIYHTELGPFPFPRSVKALEALARVRGAQSGCQYAEGFMVLKMMG